MFQESKAELREWLLNKAKSEPAYLKAIEAMEKSEQYHSGFRKDGVVEEFQHQINIANSIRPFVESLKYPAETFVIVFLHDLIEDYGINDPVWDEKLPRLIGLSPVPFSYITTHYSSLIAESLDAISKKVDDKKKKSKHYFKGISTLAIASVVKLADRIDNLTSMLCVFTVEKQVKYAEEAEKYFLDFLSIARSLYPEQKVIYDAFEEKIKSQIQGVRETQRYYEENNLDMATVPVKPAKFKKLNK